MLISGTAFNTEECAVCTLTKFEVGNVLWKENKKKKLKNPKQVAEIFSEALSELQKLDIDSIVNVITLAMERDLTFYDASYVSIAEKEGLALVTEDLELLKKSKCAISTKDIEKT